MGIIAKYFESINIKASYDGEQLPLTDQQKIAELLADVATLKTEMATAESEIDALQLVALDGDSLSVQALARITELESPLESVDFTQTELAANRQTVTFDTDLDDGSTYLVKAKVEGVEVSALISPTANHKSLYWAPMETTYGNVTTYYIIFIEARLTWMQIKAMNPNYEIELVSVSKIMNW